MDVKGKFRYSFAMPQFRFTAKTLDGVSHSEVLTFEKDYQAQQNAWRWISNGVGFKLPDGTMRFYAPGSIRYVDVAEVDSMPGEPLPAPPPPPPNAKIRLGVG